MKSNSELGNRSILTDCHSQPASLFLLTLRKYKQVTTAGPSQMITTLEGNQNLEAEQKTRSWLKDSAVFDEFFDRMLHFIEFSERLFCRFSGVD